MMTPAGLEEPRARVVERGDDVLLEGIVAERLADDDVDALGGRHIGRVHLGDAAVGEAVVAQELARDVGDLGRLVEIDPLGAELGRQEAEEAGAGADVGNRRLALRRSRVAAPRERRRCGRGRRAACGDTRCASDGSPRTGAPVSTRNIYTIGTAERDGVALRAMQAVGGSPVRRVLARDLLAARLRAVGGALGEADLRLRGLLDRVEVGLLVADRDRGIALRRAVVGLPLRAAMQIDDLDLVALHQHALVLDDVAVGVERDDVGDAEGLAGDDQQVAGLHRDVGDRRVADDDLGGGPRQAQELGLVVFDDQVVGGLGGPGSQGTTAASIATAAARPRRLSERSRRSWRHPCPRVILLVRFLAPKS